MLICMLPDVNYIQGMNFIAAFLLMINEDEEESFYIQTKKFLQY